MRTEPARSVGVIDDRGTMDEQNDVIGPSAQSRRWQQRGSERETCTEQLPTQRIVHNDPWRSFAACVSIRTMCKLHRGYGTVQVRGNVPLNDRSQRR